ncbi:MAG: hypothetical protein RJA36_2620 [Pseudomonadota bacterium]|jgi:uncharacterized cupredoxin-like copper-binding protein
MQDTLHASRKLIALMALSLSGAVLAGGNHAGGHEHGDAGSAIGQPGAASRVDRTITVEMSDDMRFTPADIRVRQGETVRLLVRNQGQLRHELSLGSRQELLQHLEVMKRFPDMEHDEPGKVTLAPGQQGEIVWQFSKAGTVDFACLVPGHYEAGMLGAIQVGRK